MNVDLSKSTAIVTGGSKGYGKGIAQALKQKGVDVWITGRDDKSLNITAEEISVNAIRADVCESKDWDRVFDQVLKASGGKIDILVNNAGAGICKSPITEQTDEQIELSIAVNLTGAILGCRRAAKVMKHQKSGTIINVSSICARNAWPGWSVYSAAKAGLVMFSKCLFTELREAGIRVTSIIPSWSSTAGFNETLGLTARNNDIASKCIHPLELGELVIQICSLPKHLLIQDVTLLPMVQEIVPL